MRSAQIFPCACLIAVSRARLWAIQRSWKTIAMRLPCSSLISTSAVFTAHTVERQRRPRISQITSGQLRKCWRKRISSAAEIYGFSSGKMTISPHFCRQYFLTSNSVSLNNFLSFGNRLSFNCEAFLNSSIF